MGGLDDILDWVANFYAISHFNFLSKIKEQLPVDFCLILM
jgi:hypothetical protein